MSATVMDPPEALDIESALVVTHNPATGKTRIEAGRYKDCKHWGRDTGGDYGERELEEHPGMGTCNKIFDDNGGLAHIYAIWCDGGIYGFTAPEFGCVLFEPKESDAPVVPQGCPDERGHDLEGGDICVYCGLDAARVEAETQKP